VAACRASRAPYLRALAALVQDGRTSRAVGAVAAGTPVLLAGDLNALRWEGPIRALAGRGLADAFRAGSWRLGPTWSPHPWSPALARIDYVWMPEGASAEGAWALAVPGSDHRAVVADVALP
jgi:endonuclease/exonuclease/phosphatase (EEP) superfamily protein YafD